MGALDGITVIDASLLVQGPQAAAMLHDLGADVVKVELPGVGDHARSIRLGPDDHRAPYFEACNRGKRSVAVDLRTPGGRGVFLRLCERADVVITNFAVGTMDRWGLGDDVLAAANPRLVRAYGSVVGPRGPGAQREGADLVAQALGGLISTTGRDGDDVTPVGATVADHSASQNMVIGILAALIARTSTGLGQRVDVSLLGGQVWAQASEVTAYLLSGRVAGRANGGHPLIKSLYRVFRTADGWIAVVGVPPQLWPGFCRAIGRPDLEHEARWAGRNMRPEVAAELWAVLEPIFATRTTEDWCARLAAEHQRFAPVQDHAALAADPHVRLNGYLVDVPAADGADGRSPARSVIGNPVGLSATPVRIAAEAPALGEHTDEVLLALGYDGAQLASLRAAGAIG